MHSSVQNSIIYNSKIWKQSKCPWINEWIKKMWWIFMYIYIFAGILFSHKKQRSLAICNYMDGPRECYAQWSKSHRKINTTYLSHLYVESKRQMNKQNRNRYREQTACCQREQRWEDEWHRWRRLRAENFPLWSQSVSRMCHTTWGIQSIVS